MIKDTIRDSNFEILRIISMVLIISHHYTMHGQWTITNEVSVNNYTLDFLVLGGKLGVNCFVLITGYFMVHSTFKLDKLFKILAQVFFYSVTIALIFAIFNIPGISLKLIIKSFFPIIFKRYWFMSSYVILYILIPYLNKFIATLSKEQYLRLLIISTLLISFLPTFTKYSFNFGDIGWFIYIYFLGAYIKEHAFSLFNKNYFNLLIFIITYMLISLSTIFFRSQGITEISDITGVYRFSLMESFPLLICSISLFLYFKNITIKSNKIINCIARSTLGIYLIHDNVLLRQHLWTSITHNALFYHSEWLLLHALVTIIAVFIVCMFIDLLRIRYIEEPLFHFIKKNELSIKHIYDSVLLWLENKYHPSV